MFPDAAAQPSFHSLDRHIAEEILARNHVGRIAFTYDNRIDVQPVHYVYADGWIYGRTSRGTKLDVIAHHPWVAFEIDEVEGMFDWRSVVVKGTCEVILSSESNPATTLPAAHIYWRAVQLLRTLAPDAFTPDDRVPFRHVLFRIHLDEVTARQASSKSTSMANRPDVP